MMAYSMSHTTVVVIFASTILRKRWNHQEIKSDVDSNELGVQQIMNCQRSL